VRIPLRGGKETLPSQIALFFVFYRRHPKRATMSLTKESLESWKTLTDLVAPVFTMLFGLIGATMETVKKVKSPALDDTTTNKVTIWGKISILGIVVSGIISLFSTVIDKQIKKIDDAEAKKTAAVKRQQDSVYQRKIDSINLASARIIKDGADMAKILGKSLQVTTDIQDTSRATLHLLGSTYKSQQVIVEEQNSLVTKNEELLYPLLPLRVTVDFKIPFANWYNKAFAGEMRKFSAYMKSLKDSDDDYSYLRKYKLPNILDNRGFLLWYTIEKNNIGKYDSTFNFYDRYLREHMDLGCDLSLYKRKIPIDSVSEMRLAPSLRLQCELSEAVDFTYAYRIQVSNSTLYYSISFVPKKFSYLDFVPSLYSCKGGSLAISMASVHTKVFDILQSLQLECGNNFADKYGLTFDKGKYGPYNGYFGQVAKGNYQKLDGNISEDILLDVKSLLKF
jgi:hypothetical protein